MSKSRGERGNKTPSSQNNQPTHQIAIIPGKFLECDWIDLVENESCEEFITDIVNDTVTVACDLIFKNIIEERVQPYSIFCAKELILDLIELQFLQCDSGDGAISNYEPWLEDDEPNACITDSWAQGAVPVFNKTSTTKTTPETEPVIDEKDYDDDDEEDAKSSLSSITDVIRGENDEEEEFSSSNSQILNVGNLSIIVSNGSFEKEENEVEIDQTNIKLVPTPPPINKTSMDKSNQLRRKGYKSHGGSLPKFTAISLTPVTDEPGIMNSPNHHAEFSQSSCRLHPSDSLLKHQHGRLPCSQDVVYDENGNVIRVPKMNVASLPKHRIRTKFSIIDPVKEANRKARLRTSNVKSKNTCTISCDENREDSSIINSSFLLQQFYNNKKNNKNNNKNKNNNSVLDQMTSLRTPLPPPMVAIPVEPILSQRMSKSRGERGNKTPSSQNNQPTHQIAIIPGKFLECDWIDLVENESCEEFITDIVNDTVTVACDLIFKNIIEERVQPYSIFCAKELILDLIELQFLQCDSGDGAISNYEPWLEDDEPNACITDSWAQGAVPVFNKTSTTKTTPETEPVIDEKDYDDDDEEDAKSSLSSITDVIRGENDEEEEFSSSNSQILNVGNLSIIVSNGSFEKEENEVEIDQTNIKLVPTPPPINKTSMDKSNQLRRKGYKSHGGSLPKFTAISLTPVTDEPGIMNSPNHHAEFSQSSCRLHPSDSLLKHQHGRLPCSQDVVYDENGNVIRVPKMNVASLPKHRIRTKFSIIDPVKEANRKARLRTSNVKSKNTCTISCDENREDSSIINSSFLLQQFYNNKKNNKNNNKNKNNNSVLDQMTSLRTPLPPPMVDIVDVAEGVVIREGTLSKQGSIHKTIDNKMETALQPIVSEGVRKLEIQDIITTPSPIINNRFPRSKPLPVILT